MIDAGPQTCSPAHITHMGVYDPSQEQEVDITTWTAYYQARGLPLSSPAGAAFDSHRRMVTHMASHNRVPSRVASPDHDELNGTQFDAQLCCSPPR